MSKNKTPVMAAITKSRSVKILKFTLALFLCVHLCACGWYLTAALSHDPQETWLMRRTVVVGDALEPLLFRPPEEQWLHSVYLVLTVFTSVGFGDIYAVSV